MAKNSIWRWNFISKSSLTTFFNTENFYSTSLVTVFSLNLYGNSYQLKLKDFEYHSVMSRTEALLEATIWINLEKNRH